jgi:phytoene/squalene synthetase
VDDLLDGETLTDTERNQFLLTQRQLLQSCLESRPSRTLSAEEWLLVDLKTGDLGQDPGLRIYLQDMMDVMAFDTLRRGKRIDTRQLTWYSRRLATAVTEAVYTFIGDRCLAPRAAERYAAADAAHIIHMLRDMHQDLDAGYINIPVDVIPGHEVNRSMLNGPIVKDWVRRRIELARDYFTIGENYLNSIQNRRCRMAGAWYATRFAGVMKAIEHEDYLLRDDYSDCKGNRMMLHMLWEGFRAALPRTAWSIPAPDVAAVTPETETPLIPMNELMED